MGDDAELKALQDPRFARWYVRMSRAVEERGVGEHRRRLLAGLAGQVIEVGAGNGLNFAHYPGTVHEVTAVEPNAYLRVHAARAAEAAPVPVRVVEGHAAALPGTGYDAAVVSLVLCSVGDPVRALEEIHRVLRPGGELRFYEHVQSANPLIAAVQDLVTPVWSRLAGGCHPNRDTAALIRRCGFTVTSLDRFGFSPGRPVPKVAHIIGTARRD